MYSQEDLNSAVAAGAISADAAQALRAHVAASRDAVPADAEHFRLLTGFNDIFVSIGVVILLMAVGAIGLSISETSTPGNAFEAAFMPLFPAALVAGTAWLLAEFFTRKRRMALPSIILLLAFVFAALVAIGALVFIPFALIFGPAGFEDEAMNAWKPNDTTVAILASIMTLITGALTAAAAWMHWRRFMVPITVAAGTAALVGMVIAAIQSTRMIVNDGDVAGGILPIVFIAGLAVFAFAMWWDMSDTRRETRRSDVAFWLHLLAAPLIAHPIFAMIGVIDGDNIGVGAALGVLAVYVAFGVVALAVDRRALLVSALAYVLFALTFLFREFGAVELSFALTALVIGSALLTLSALWTPIRRAVVDRLPGDMQVRLPTTA